MPNPFVCGANGFQEEEEEDSLSFIQGSTPRRSSRKGKSSNNPFSTRGLDKFNTLLAELEDKKQKIYSQMGSNLDQDNSLVRFVYSSSKDDVVPIVIRLNKDGKHAAKSKSGELVKEKVKYHHSAVDHRRSVLDKSPVEARRVVPENGNKEEVITKQEKSDKRPRLICYPNWRRPSFYMPVAIVLILLFLVFFGRSVAILCTSVGWYLVPTLSSTKPAAAKKDFRRGTSEIKMVNNGSSPSPPRSSNNKAGRENWHRQSDTGKASDEDGCFIFENILGRI